MSFGKMNTAITLLQTAPDKDAEGFVTAVDHTLTTCRAYKEERHGNEYWANRSAFSTATALFRFRVIPGLVVTTSLFISCDGARYRILSVENVKGRGMYIEVLAEILKPSVG